MRAPKSQRLVVQHLEKVSGKILEEYPNVIREFIRSRGGVYALYRKEHLYYVGLASNLMARLKTHLRDRHRLGWDRFSVYITLRDGHIKELESLLIRIVGPKGKSWAVVSSNHRVYFRFSTDGWSMWTPTGGRRSSGATWPVDGAGQRAREPGAPERLTGWWSAAFPFGPSGGRRRLGHLSAGTVVSTTRTSCFIRPTPPRVPPSESQ